MVLFLAWPSKAKLKVIAFVVSHTLVFAAGWHVRDLIADRHDAKVETLDAKADLARTNLVKKIGEQAQAIAQHQRDEHDTAQAQVRTVYKTIREKVPYYVPSQAVGEDRSGNGSDSGLPDAGGRSTLPLGAVRLHDYAALGSDPPVPAPSGEPVTAPSGVELPAFIGTVADNYGVCREWRTEVEAWREWYAREAEAWDKAAVGEAP